MTVNARKASWQATIQTYLHLNVHLNQFESVRITKCPQYVKPCVLCIDNLLYILAQFFFKDNNVFFFF